MTNAATMTVLKRSVFLWVGAGLIFGLNIFAANQPSRAVFLGALVATGIYALIGIAFGIWAARTITRHPSTS